MPITLPERPLKLSRKARTGYLAAYLGALVLIAIGAFLMVWEAGDLQRDWKISRNPVVVDGEVRDGECTTRKAIFTDCEGHLVYAVDGTQYETDVALMFVDIHTGDYMVNIVRSADEPQLATMSIGIDKLWNRLGLFGFLMLCTVGGGLVLLWQGAQNMRAASILARPAAFSAIPVSIESAAKSGKRTNYTIRDPAGRRPKKKFIASFRRNEEPFLVETDRGVVGVAVKHPASPVPILLDSELKRLDLTPEERDAAVAALRGPAVR
ncbi:MAG: hypothetical protein U1E58_09390 [Tabrizicola sp.]